MPYKAGNEFVTLSKMSKKQKAEYYKQRRNLWETSPVTKIVPSKKLYSRKRRWDYE